jgi:glycosyltransferase involved in cell wall biosynthesis
VTMRRPLAIVTSGFPRVSETFALNELLALHRSGAVAAIFATKPGDGLPNQPGVEALLGRVEVLEPGPVEAQSRQVVERLRGTPVIGVHAYFAHAPAAVAAHAARRLGVPYSFSMHARDARKVARSELHERARAAACVIACNEDVAGELRGGGTPVELVPHGVDLGRFEAAPPADGGTLRVLSVARLVEKKGIAVLVEAAAALRVPFRLCVVGEGPLAASLALAARRAGLGDRVEFCGALTHHELPRAYADAHVVAVPSVRDSSDDRDGLPNVVLEAMACGRPVVASAVGAIPSAVRDGETGLLTRPGDAAGLGSALARLAGNSALRTRLGHAARALVERRFELEGCTARLLGTLERAYA